MKQSTSPLQDSRIGRTIRRLRRERGVSLRRFAGTIGISPATLSGIETGKIGLTVQRLQTLAEELGTSPAVLVEDAPVASHSLRPPAAGVDSEPRENWRRFDPLDIDPVLAAAIRAFVVTGYHGANMRSIATDARISVPGVYHHYPSKQKLLVRILEITMEDLTWRVERAGTEGSDALRRVEFVVQALALFHVQRNDLAFIGASEMRSLEPENYRRIANLRDHVQQVLDEQISAAIEQHGIGVGEARSTGKAIVTMCTALAQWFNPAGKTTPAQIAQQYSRFALRMLGAPEDSGDN